jgi:hypothetical protein
MQELLQVQQLVEEKAFQRQAEYDYLRYQENGQRQATTFAVGSYVVVQYEGQGHRPPHKLAALRRGPFEVVDVDDTGNAIIVQDLTSNKRLSFHISLVQPYLFRQGDPHPRIVANKAAGVYVEAINL